MCKLVATLNKEMTLEGTFSMIVKTSRRFVTSSTQDPLLHYSDSLPGGGAAGGRCRLGGGGGAGGGRGGGHRDHVRGGGGPRHRPPQHQGRQIYQYTQPNTLMCK